MQIIELKNANGTVITVGNTPVGIAKATHNRVWLVAPTDLAETADDVQRSTDQAKRELTTRAVFASKNGKDTAPEAPD